MFPYRSASELQAALAAAGYAAPVADGWAGLGTPIVIGKAQSPNRLVAQPMEGCDADAQGSPTELTFRKYLRLASGGWGVIWFEACAVAPQGRSNPRHLWLHEGNVAKFAELVRQTRQSAAAAGSGPVGKCVCVLQLTHGGRYAKPTGTPAPIIAHHSAVLDARHNLPADYPLISDDELDALPELYATATRLAAQAGFDAVDIKACHGYLLNELLAAHTRDGRYGGGYENRTRLLKAAVTAAREAGAGGIEIVSRLSGCDAIDWPYGWGVAPREGMWQVDLSEPLRLCGELAALGVACLNVTIGNPYFNPHINRPSERMIAGWPTPPEPPIAGQARILKVVGEIQGAMPGVPVIGSGYSWMRQFAPAIAAGAVQAGAAALVGFGRQTLAYPDMPVDLLVRGKLDDRKLCTACSSCSQMMRDGMQSGCPVRDAEVYGPIFREGRRRATTNR